MPPKRSTTRTPARKRSGAGAKRKAPARSNRPAIVVEDLADFNESINFIVYGDSGVGKTPFAGAAPNAVFLSTEKGTISAKRFGSKAKLIRATSWLKVEAAIDYLEENPDGFDWVILDSLTKLQVLLLRYLLEVNVEEGLAKADLDLPALADHQKWQNMFKRFVDRLIDLDVNVIFIATAMHKEDAEGEDLVLPHVEGKDYAISQYVCAQADGVYCLKVKSDKRGEPYWRLLTKTTPPYFAKDRYKALPRVVERPTMPAIIEAIQNSIAEGEPLAADSSAPEPVEPEDLDDDDEEPEPESRPNGRKRSGPTGSTRQRRTARSGQKSHADDDLGDDDEDDEEEEPEPPKREARRTTRRPARTARQSVKRTKRPEPDEDDESDDSDDFDPDDIDLEEE